MRVLLVYCHPVETSFIAAVQARAVAALRDAGHEVDVCDLYAEGFDPVLSRQERLDYHDTARNTGPVEAHVERLRRAEGLVLVFPTWWYGLPAMLKGYFDRVWLPGVSFEVTGGAIRPMMGNIRKMAVLTTYGSPWWLIQLLGHPNRRVLGSGVRRLCAPGTKCLWLAHYAMDRSTPESRDRFLAKVEREMARF